MVLVFLMALMGSPDPSLETIVIAVGNVMLWEDICFPSHCKHVSYTVFCRFSGSTGSIHRISSSDFPFVNHMACSVWKHFCGRIDTNKLIKAKSN